MTDEPAEGSGCAGATVAVVVSSGVLGGLWAAAPDWALLGLWGVGAGSVWWAVRRPNKIDIPAPPPEGDPSSETNTQVSIVEGDHPHHWRVIHNPVDEGTTT